MPEPDKRKHALEAVQKITETFYRARCACGWVSTRHVEEDSALSAMDFHLEQNHHQ